MPRYFAGIHREKITRLWRFGARANAPPVAILGRAVVFRLGKAP
jgi:hypothetical protein